MSTEALEQERDSLRRELRGTQEMLAQVLKAVGHPVQVNKDQMNSLKEGTQIMIDDNQEYNAFVFSLVEPE